MAPDLLYKGGPSLGPGIVHLTASAKGYFVHFVTSIRITKWNFWGFWIQELNNFALHVVQNRGTRFGAKRGPDIWHPFCMHFRAPFERNPGRHFEKSVATFWPKSVTTFGTKSVTTFGPKSVTTIFVELWFRVAWKSRLHVAQHFCAVFEGFQGMKKSTSLRAELFGSKIPL